MRKGREGIAESGHAAFIHSLAVVDHQFFNVQYSDKFAEQISDVPGPVFAEWEEMYLELQSDPEHGLTHQVVPSIYEDNVYHMLFSWFLATVSYTVQHEPVKLSLSGTSGTRDSSSSCH